MNLTNWETLINTIIIKCTNPKCICSALVIVSEYIETFYPRSFFVEDEDSILRIDQLGTKRIRQHGPAIFGPSLLANIVWPIMLNNTWWCSKLCLLLSIIFVDYLLRYRHQRMSYALWSFLCVCERLCI